MPEAGSIADIFFTLTHWGNMVVIWTKWVCGAKLRGAGMSSRNNGLPQALTARGRAGRTLSEWALNLNGLIGASLPELLQEAQKRRPVTV